jgi:zinc transporter
MAESAPARPFTAPIPLAPALLRDDGLICAYRFEPGHPAQEIGSAAEAARLVAAPITGFIWLHFNLSHSATGHWLREHAGLSDRFHEELSGGSRSARIDRDGEALLAVLNDVTYDFQYEAKEVETLWMSVGARLVVSARLRPLRAVDQLRSEVRRGAVVDNSIDLLDRLLQTQADELQAIVRKAGERLDDIEDAVLAGSHRAHARELARLRRLMVRLQRLLTPEPAALARVIARPPAWMGPADLPHLVQANEEFTLVLRDIAALQERVRLVQDECATRLNEENGRSLFTLTMVTVLALPINLVSGLFGMNVGGIPLAEHPAGFWLMVTFIATVTLLIARQVWRRMRAQEG